jgi:hypothetical protein
MLQMYMCGQLSSASYQSLRLQADLIQIQAMQRSEEEEVGEEFPLQSDPSTGSKAVLLPYTTSNDDLEFENSPHRQDSKESQDEGKLISFHLSLQINFYY